METLGTIMLAGGSVLMIIGLFFFKDKKQAKHES
jgi:hypothetical protein